MAESRLGRSRVEVLRLRREEKLGPAAITHWLGIGRASVYRLLGKEAAVKANGVSMPIRPEMRGLYPSSRLASVPPHVIVMTRRATLPHSGRVIATPRVAGFKSELVAGFIPELVAGLFRNQD